MAENEEVVEETEVEVESEPEKPVKKSTKKSKQSKDKSGRFVKKSTKKDKAKDDPEPTTETESNPVDDILKVTLDGLKEKNSKVDFSWQSVPDQIRSYRALGEPEPEPSGDKNPDVENPLVDPAMAENVYIPTSKRNETKSFLAKLDKFSNKGGDILEKMGFETEK